MPTVKDVVVRKLVDDNREVFLGCAPAWRGMEQSKTYIGNCVLTGLFNYLYEHKDELPYDVTNYQLYEVIGTDILFLYPKPFEFNAAGLAINLDRSAMLTVKLESEPENIFDKDYADYPDFESISIRVLPVFLDMEDEDDRFCSSYTLHYAKNITDALNRVEYTEEIPE